MKSTFALGIDLGGSKIEALALALDGNELWRRRIATPAGDYGATLDAIANLVQQANGELGTASDHIGIGTPGSLTPEGLLKNSNSTCLNGMPLQRDLEQRLGQAVCVANDANCLALSEATDGTGAGATVVFAAILGTGVGAGIAIDGKVLTGPNGLTGEWGHNPLPWAVAGQDPVLNCYCGKQGCAESLLCGPGLARDHQTRGGTALSAAQIAHAASQGDAACAATLERYASRLARAFAQVINLLDPSVIVLGGGLSHIDVLYQRVPELWSQWVFAGGVKDRVRTRMLPSLHGDASGVRGAAWLWRERGLKSKVNR